jgi:hypothetical protein
VYSNIKNSMESVMDLEALVSLSGARGIRQYHHMRIRIGLLLVTEVSTSHMCTLRRVTDRDLCPKGCECGSHTLLVLVGPQEDKKHPKGPRSINTWLIGLK